jgi:predicted RNA binding protein YcfA (HicA-like mRNA interferase family)
MNAAAKLLKAMRNNPHDWQIEQLITVARENGLTVRNRGGSHHVFSHGAAPENLSVPVHRPIKPVYIRAFVALCDKVKEAQ